MSRRLTFAGLLLLATLAGCRSAPREAFISVARVPIDLTQPAADDVWEGMKDVLRRDLFTLDRVDRHGGVITTRPEISRQLFEFWRRDARSLYEKLKSGINPLRRYVVVRATPDEDLPGTTLLEVAVYKQRLTSPDRQFNSSGAAYQFFDPDLPSTTGAPSVGLADERWIDLGRDPDLEDYYLRQFLALAAAGASAPPSDDATAPSDDPEAPAAPREPDGPSPAPHGG
jgi:hypothetical protein